MERRRAILAVLAGVLVACSLGAATSYAASEGGPVTRNCTRLSGDLRGPCRGGEQVVSAGTAACRWAGAPDAACRTPITPKASEQDIQAFQGSWLDRALQAQYEL